MLHHKEFRNTQIATPFGVVTVDDKGLTTGITPEQEQELAKVVFDFHYEEDKKTETKEEEPEKTPENPEPEVAKKPKKPAKKTTGA